MYLLVPPSGLAVAGRLAALAERACDDLAMTWTGQRAQYARYLLEFARSMAEGRGRGVLAGLSMADGGDLPLGLERFWIGSGLSRGPCNGPSSRRSP